MFKKIWDFLSQLRLSFWLILCITATLTAGSVYSRLNYQFFEYLDTRSVFAWFSKFGLNNPGKSWWVALLYTLMGFLALNALACSIERLRALWPKRRETTPARFLTLLSPSIIHLLFVLIMGGHFLTFNCSVHARYPIEPGHTITLPDDKTVRIEGIDIINYPKDSYLQDRLRDAVFSIEVMSDGGKAAYSFSFLKPLFLDGAFLHADVSSKRVVEMSATGVTVCSRAEVKHTEENIPQFYILYTKDPGLFVIVGLLCLIMCAMIWYYANILSKKNGKRPWGVRTA
ncbi:MAG: hypothetical protein ACOWYE_02225 [Desulfatiglandales bacterium]